MLISDLKKISESDGKYQMPDEEHIDKMRKGWEKLLFQYKSIRSYNDAVLYLNNMEAYIDRLTEDVLINFGFWTADIKKEETIVQKRLKQAKDIVNNGQKYVYYTPRTNDVDWKEVVLEQVVRKIGPYMGSPGLRSFDIFNILKKNISEIQKRYKTGISDFSIGKMKITWWPSIGRDLHTIKGKIISTYKNPEFYRDYGVREILRGPDLRGYIKYIKKAKALLDQKGFGFLWYGNMFIGSRKERKLKAKYFFKKDAVMVFEDPGDDTVWTIIHELGHRYYSKYMSNTDRNRFRDEFIRQVAVPVSNYGKRHDIEDFAEVFAWYVLNRNLTRDQLERLKSYFKHIREEKNLISDLRRMIDGYLYNME